MDNDHLVSKIYIYVKLREDIYELAWFGRYNYRVRRWVLRPLSIFLYFTSDDEDSLRARAPPHPPVDSFSFELTIPVCVSPP
jgi:hypothetical protein